MSTEKHTKRFNVSVVVVDVLWVLLVLSDDI
jgi:hypothetical protein